MIPAILVLYLFAGLITAMIVANPNSLNEFIGRLAFLAAVLGQGNCNGALVAVYGPCMDALGLVLGCVQVVARTLMW